MNPGLHEFNLASHLVWWVAGIAMAVLGVVAGLEAWEGVRGWWRRRRGGSESSSGAFEVRDGGRVRRP